MENSSPVEAPGNEDGVSFPGFFFLGERDQFGDFPSHPANHVPTGKSSPVWLLKTSGLLLDSEVAQFVNKMSDPDARREFALKAMELQLRFLDADKNP